MSLGKRSRRMLLASIMLVAFASRALVPLGFMPAGDQPFSIEICWEGFPAATLAHGEPPHSMAAHSGAHHHHSGSPSHSEHCVFGTACSAGPISHLPLLSENSSAQPLRAVAFVSFAAAVHLVHLPQPRAPPGRLS